MEKNSMLFTLTFIFTALFCLGYFLHRKNVQNAKNKPPKKSDDLKYTTIQKDVLSLQDILDWIDGRDELISEDGVSYEVNVFPNSSTKDLLKIDSQSTYAVILRRTRGEKKEVVTISAFQAKELDETLNALKADNVVNIPISL